MKYIYQIELKVRDYECDIQGIVNNSCYQHYMEHARHEFLETTGKSFVELTAEGIIAMVSNVNIQYKTSLRGGDKFVVCINIYRKGIKLVFVEDIYRVSDNALCAKGLVEIVYTQNGKLGRGEIFDELLGDFL